MRVDQQEGYDAWKQVTSELSSDQEFLVQSVEAVAGYAEEFKDKNNLSAAEALRQGYTQYQNQVGVLHPNIMARILSVFAIWWVYGEDFVKEMTSFETTVVMFGILEYQKELQHGGSEQSDGRAEADGLPEDHGVPETTPE